MRTSPPLRTQSESLVPAGSASGHRLSGDFAGAVGCFQVYVFNIHPGAGEKSGIKRPLGKGIPLITEAKIIKKPRRKQLNNRVGLGCSNLVSSNEDSPEFGLRFSSVSTSEVISFKGGKLLAGKLASCSPPILTKYKVAKRER
ncbi:hypothetical protein [Hyella patelloides]|uniref:hypothetical protein n=1 Tax=Hyella patelloides TaxID=1982969 RepID=UPI0011A1CDFB|nr:hypothetical protein [Hyella patelloides]